ncbi:MAG: hypothetical protein V2A70_01595 [Candidatus Omnitrophota bacterium]
MNREIFFPAGQQVGCQRCFSGTAFPMAKGGLCQRAFVLWEIALGIVVVFFLAGSLQCTLAGVLLRARVARTYQDMSAILDTGLQYEAGHASWPQAEELWTLLPQGGRVNPWGESYRLGQDGGRLWVETSLPKGVAGVDLPKDHFVQITSSGSADMLRMSTIIKRGIAWRLVYEQRRQGAF